LAHGIGATMRFLQKDQLKIAAVRMILVVVIWECPREGMGSGCNPVGVNRRVGSIPTAPTIQPRTVNFFLLQGDQRCQADDGQQGNHLLATGEGKS
jgi:hypothetical protein